MMMMLSSTPSPGISWDEQIVPTLKERLESESHQLTNRLSATFFPPLPTPNQPLPDLISPKFPAHPRTAPANRTPSSGLPLPRSRTVSSPLSAHPKTARQGRSIELPPTARTQRLQSGTKSDLVAGGRLSQEATKEVDKTISESANHSSNGSKPTTSRIPTRSRSNSSLSTLGKSRPSVGDMAPPPLPHQSIPLASGIPVLKGRTVSPPKHGLSLPGGPINVDRNSLELQSETTKTREGFIKNELPPFRMGPDEALRIARRGHEGLKKENVDGETKRKRAQTMTTNSPVPAKKSVEMTRSKTPVGKSSRPLRDGSSSSNESDQHPGSIDDSPPKSEVHREPSTGRSTPTSQLPVRSRLVSAGMSSASTGLGLGLGQPSSSRRIASSSTSISGLASSSSQRTASGTPHKTKSPALGNSATRSVSHNVLASSTSSNPTTPSSSRFVAAHFIPPETSYTPPKGADWDDVVLPTVAKKLGMDGVGVPEPGEGDLAVEWDKEGRAIKWVKRSVGGKLNINTSFENSIDQSFNTVSIAPSPSSSSFSPSFDPSPENPMHRPYSNSPLRPKSSASSVGNDGSIELGPIRTSSALPTSLPMSSVKTLHPDDSFVVQPPSSPAPFRNPDTQIPIPKLPRGLDTTSHPISIRQQSSHRSLRPQDQSGTDPRRPEQIMAVPTILLQPSTPNPALFPQFSEFQQENEIGGEGRGKGQKEGNGKTGKKRKDSEEVGRGCGCLIM